jgi:hypothetical protein
VGPRHADSTPRRLSERIDAKPRDAAAAYFDFFQASASICDCGPFLSTKAVTFASFIFLLIAQCYDLSR